MLVDINLLPKKEQKNIASLLLVAVALVLFVSSFIYIYWQKTSTEQAINQLDQETEITNEILSMEQQKIIDYQSSNAVEQLEKAINWTAQLPFNMNFVVQELTKLLPERGFILDFAYTDSAVDCMIQFDVSAEAAYYLNALLNLPWLTEATLTERKTEFIDESEQTTKKDSVLPRYVAQYEMKIDLNAVKTLSKKKTKQPAKSGGDLS